jgi:hypothetical protein
MRPCPNCGIAGNSFGCTNHIITYGTLQPADLVLPGDNSQILTALFAEIGRLHVRLSEAEDRAQGLEKMINTLKEQKVIDQLGRPLPLKDHIPSCPHGQTGWAYCTCDRQSETQELEAAMGFGIEKPIVD